MKVKVEKAAAQRGFAGSVDAAAQADVLQREGAADVSAVLEEVGLDAKTGWYAAILLYGTGGLVTAALQLLMPNVIPVGVFYLALVAMVLGGLCVPGALYWSNSNVAAHARLLAGGAIFITGAFVAGPAREAWVLLPLFILVTPAYLYGARFAIPYALMVTTLAFVILLDTDGPATFAHAWVTVGAIWMIVAAFMVAETTTRRLARLNRRMAYTDPLTGIANTRRLREQLTEALGKGFGEGSTFALFAIDLDNFKLVNDTFDHSTGDRVLCAVAEELSSEVDHFDLVARRGGDEFSVLAVDIGGRDLDALARRLADAIGRARMRTCPQVSPSGSVAYVLSQSGDTIASILQRADDELHDAKRAFHTEHGERDDIEVRTYVEGDVVAEILPRVPDSDNIAAAIGRAYAPRPSAHRRNLQRRYESTRQWVQTLDPRWSFSAVALLPAAFSVAFLTLVGALEPLPTTVGLFASFSYVALFLVGMYASHRHWNVQIMTLGFLTATAITCWLLWQAGEAGTALLDILPVLVLYAFYFLGPRQGGLLLLPIMGAYAAFAIVGDYHYGLQRAVLSTLVVIVCAGLVLKVRNVTLRFAKQHAELSETDALTGLANMRSLAMRVEDTVELAQSGVVRPVILTIDLDKFKLVNDSYNHTVGDRVIEAVARAISETVRSDEMVARRGGDEFFVLFNDPGESHIGVVVERLHAAIEHARQRICPDLPNTASIGVVGWRLGESAEDFMSRADAAMHDEKLASRARGYERQTA